MIFKMVSLELVNRILLFLILILLIGGACYYLFVQRIAECYLLIQNDAVRGGANVFVTYKKGDGKYAEEVVNKDINLCKQYYSFW